MLQLFRAYEEAYYGHLEGDVDPRLWREWEAAMRDINGYPGVEDYWRSRSHWYSEEFAKYINQLQQTAKPPRLYREPIGDECSNQSMKPTAPPGNESSVFATTPCRGL